MGAQVAWRLGRGLTRRRPRRRQLPLRPPARRGQRIRVLGQVHRGHAALAPRLHADLRAHGLRRETGGRRAHHHGHVRRARRQDAPRVAQPVSVEGSARRYYRVGHGARHARDDGPARRARCLASLKSCGADSHIGTGAPIPMHPGCGTNSGVTGARGPMSPGR